MKVKHPVNNNVKRGNCPATFEGASRKVESLSAYDVPVVDAKGQQPRLSDHLAVLGVPLTKGQWDQLVEMEAALPTPWNCEWTPTFERVVLGLDGKPIDPEDDEAVKAATVTHEVVDCPNCGTPIKVG